MTFLRAHHLVSSVPKDPSVGVATVQSPVSLGQAELMGAMMQRLAPHYAADQIQMLADGLSESRTLITGDLQRANRLRLALWNSLYLPIQSRARPLDEIVDSANRAVEAVLNGP